MRGDEHRQGVCSCLARVCKPCCSRYPFAPHHLIPHLCGCIMGFFKYAFFGARIMLTVYVLSIREPVWVFSKSYLKILLFRLSWPPSSRSWPVWEEDSTVCVSDSFLSFGCLWWPFTVLPRCCWAVVLQCETRDPTNVPSRSSLWCVCPWRMCRAYAERVRAVFQLNPWMVGA